MEYIFIKLDSRNAGIPRFVLIICVLVLLWTLGTDIYFSMVGKVVPRTAAHIQPQFRAVPLAVRQPATVSPSLAPPERPSIPVSYADYMNRSLREIRNILE